MDTDLWSARLAAAKRHHSLQHSQHQWDRISVDDFEADDDMRPYFSCPYCDEDFDTFAFCSHLEDEHSYESRGVVCPVCAVKVRKDMVGHMTRHHGHIFKIQRRQRFRRTGMPSGASLSLLGKEMRDAHLQVLLGGGGFRSSNTSSSNNADSFLSALMYNLPIVEGEDPAKLNTCSDDTSRKTTSTLQHCKDNSSEVSLSAEEREQKLKQAVLRAKFVQQLVLSTVLGDS